MKEIIRSSVSGIGAEELLEKTNAYGELGTLILVIGCVALFLLAVALLIHLPGSLMVFFLILGLSCLACGAYFSYASEVMEEILWSLYEI